MSGQNQKAKEAGAWRAEEADLEQRGIPLAEENAAGEEATEIAGKTGRPSEVEAPLFWEEGEPAGEEGGHDPGRGKDATGAPDEGAVAADAAGRGRRGVFAREETDSREGSPPSQEGALGSGTGLYRGDPGELMPSISRVGMLDTDRWGGGFGRVLYQRGPDEPHNGASLPDPGPTTVFLEHAVGRHAVNADTVAESDPDGVFLRFSVTGREASGPVTVTFTLSGTAVPGGEYRSDPHWDMTDARGMPLAAPLVCNGDGSYTLTIPAGQRLVSLRLPLIDNEADNPAHTVHYRLIDAPGCRIGNAGDKDVTIIDDPGAEAGGWTPPPGGGCSGPLVNIALSDGANVLRNGGSPVFSNSVMEDSGRATYYQIHLTDRSSGGAYGPLLEAVTVTVSLSGRYGLVLGEEAHPRSQDDYRLDFSDLDAALARIGASASVYDPSTGTLTFTLPAGYDGAEPVVFSGRPVADGLLEDGVPPETLHVEITSVHGNESAVGHKDCDTHVTDLPFVVIAPNPAAGLSGDAATGWSRPESGGFLPYAVSLVAGDGSGALFQGNGNAVTVSLHVDGGPGFELSDLLAPDGSGNCSGSIEYTVLNDDGSVAATGSVSVSGSGHSTSFDFDLVLPAGANRITFKLPVNDDPLGGSSGSALDNPRETVTVSITGLSGGGARLPGAPGTAHIGKTEASVTITDDAPDNPADTADDASLEGVRVGLVWRNPGGGAAAGSDCAISEGATGTILLQLYTAGGAALTAAGNPYANYTQGGGLPEDLTVNLRFADTRDGGDVLLRASAELLDLLGADKISVALNGVSHSGAAGAGALRGMDLSGDISVTLKTTFDLMADAPKLGFNAHVLGDNVNEYDAAGDYRDEHGAAQERFGLSITGVEGNESAILDSGKAVTGTISDQADGRLTLTGGQLTGATATVPGHWHYEIALTYPDGETGNSPASGAAHSMNPVPAGAALALPGEDIFLRLNFTNGSIMQQGEEYITTAYDLFLSVNGLAAGNPGVPDEAGYAGFDFSAHPEWIKVAQVGTWADNGSGRESGTFEFSVPRGYWSTPAGSAGKISLDVSQGDHVGAQTAARNGGFTVEMETPRMVDGRPEWDFKGEITGASGTAIYAQEDVDCRIELALTATAVIYENDNPNAAGVFEHVAVYSMNFSQLRNNVPLPANFRLSSDITFDFTLKSGTALFNENVRDNTLYSNMGDFAVADAEGNLHPYYDMPSLRAAFQEILDLTYGGGVTVSVSKDQGNYRFSFTIKEGVDLSGGIKIYFVATDDGIRDGGETFSGQISNVRSKDDVVDIRITDNGGSTTINDEDTIQGQSHPELLSGFALAIGEGHGYEKLVGTGLKDGQGVPVDGQVHVPLYAYILGNGAMDGVADGKILSLANLVHIYEAKTGAAYGGPGDALFKAFVTQHFSPSQDISLDLRLEGGTEPGRESQVDVDFRGKTAGTAAPGGWILVIDGDKIYFQNEFKVESINDILTMNNGAIGFGISLTGTGNNESRAANANDAADLAAGHGWNSRGNIKDFHDGPHIVGLGPVGGVAYEPIDDSHGAGGGASEHKAADKNVPYAVQLDSAAAEDMVVWMKITPNANVDAGDYSLGHGIYRFVMNGGVPGYETVNGAGVPETGTIASLVSAGKLPASFTPTDNGGAGAGGLYFFVIEKGASSHSFDFLVKDDNRTESGEVVTFQVVDMQGSEATYLSAVNGVSYAVPWSDDVPYLYCHEKTPGVFAQVLVDPANSTFYEIVNGAAVNPVSWGGAPPAWLPSPNLASDLEIRDDGFGPLAGIPQKTDAGWTDGDEAPHVTVTLADYCQEEVTVYVRITMLGGGESRTLALEVPEGAKTAFFSAAQIKALWEAQGGAMPARASFDIAVARSSGGESTAGGDSYRYIIGTDGNDHIYLGGLQGMTVTEGWLPGQAGAADAAGFNLHMHIPADNTGGFTMPPEVRFSLQFANPASPLLESGYMNSLTVTFTQAQLEAFRATGTGTDFGIRITLEGGIPVVVVTNGGHTWKSTDPGSGISLAVPAGLDKLPQALGNEVIGDANYLTYSIGGVEGAHLAQDTDTVAGVRIQDGTRATLLIFARVNGEYMLVGADAASARTLMEKAGTVEMKAALVLTDASGQLVDALGNVIAPDSAVKLDDLVQVRPTHALEFDINYGAGGLGHGSATRGSDYTGSYSVRINSGESSGDFTISVSADDFDEGLNGSGLEGFSIGLAPTAETAANSAGILSKLSGGVNGGYGNGEIIISDDRSGPEIHWSLSSSRIAESGELTVSYESRLGGGRQVVAEDVKLVFEITPDSPTGFTLDEIDSITVGGVKYGNGGLPLNAILTDNGASWLITINAALPAGTGLGSLSVKLKDDVISEGSERFSIRLKEVFGGETGIAPGGTDPVDVTVTETVNGPKADLAAVGGSEETCTVVYKLALSGGQPIGEDGVATFQLNAASMARLDAGGAIVITLPGGGAKTVGADSGYSYDSATGVLTMTLPAGSRGTDNFLIAFPIKDDSLAAEGSFGMSMTGISGGEMTQAASIAYTSRFVLEQGPTDATNGGLNIFAISTTASAGELSNCHASMRFVIGGVFSEDVIKELKLNGVTLVQGQDWEWQGGRVVVTTQPGTMLPGYEFTVYYKPDAGLADQVAATKLNIVVDSAGMVGREVVMPISNETTPGLADGPEASLINMNAVAEGADFHGTLRVHLPRLPGDGQDTAEELTVTLRLSPATLLNLSWDGLPPGVTATPGAGGVVTLTIPAGTAVPPGGDFDFGFTIPVPDNSTGADPGYTVTVTGLAGSGGRYEHYGTGAGLPVAIPVNNETAPDDLDGPTASLAVDSVTVAEGSDITGTVRVALPGLAGDGPNTAEALTLTLQISPDAAGLTLSAPYSGWLTGNTGGVVVITIPAGTAIPAGGAFDIGFTLPAPDDSLAGNTDRTLRIAGLSGDSGAAVHYETYRPDTTTTVTVTVNDESGPDGFRLGIDSYGPADNQLLYKVSLAVLGDYFGTHGALGTAISFELLTTGFSAAQLGDLLGQIDGGSHSSATLSGETLHVTLDAGYLHAGTLDFGIAVDGSEQSAHYYGVTLDGLSSAPGLESLVLDAAHASTGDQMALNLAGGGLLYGGDGNDTISGGIGDDTLYGGGGNDSLYGGAGGDLLFGGDGNDMLRGGAGNNTLYGGAGDDILHLESSGDVLYGDEGGDVFLLHDTAASGGIIGGADGAGLHGGDGMDVLRVDGSGLFLDLLSFGDGSIDGFEEVDLGSGGNTVALDTDAFARMCSGTTLSVSGTSGTVDLSGGAAVWQATGSVSGGYIEYTANHNGTDLTLMVQELLNVTGAA